MAKSQTARAPDGGIKAGLRETSVPKSPNDQVNPVIGKTVSVRRRMRRKKKAHEVNEKMLIVNEKKRDVNTNLSTQANYIEHRGTMSTAGSTRGHGGSHRGRDYRRSSNNQELPDDSVSIFQSQRTPSVGSSRRHRGFQPDEVNKNKEKLGPGGPSTVQSEEITKNLIPIDNQSKASATANRLASTVIPISTEALAPHQRTQVKDKNSNNQSFIHTQLVTMDASRPELDPVLFGGVSNSMESETSSIQVITERRPSCWSIASPPEAAPTEWNSAAANIDRPATTKLPIYRIPRPGHKTERETTSSSFNRQQAKLKPQATGSTSAAQKPHEMNESQYVATPEKDESQATARAAFRKGGHAADSLHQLQQLQYDMRLDAEQALKVKAIQEEVLANAMQVSPGIQVESDELKACSPTEDNSQARSLSVKEIRNVSSANPSQAKNNQMSTPPGKQSSAAPPHLRMQSARLGPDIKTKSLPPHLRGSASPSTTNTTKVTAHDDDIEPGKHTIPAMQDTKVPPHIQDLSATKTQPIESPISATTPLLTSQKKGDNYRPTIDMDEEIAATQPVLDIDEEIVAGLRAETSGTYPAAQPADINAQETSEQVTYVPRHNRVSSSTVKVSAAEYNSKVANKNARPQADVRADSNDNVNTRSDGFVVTPYSGALQDVTSKRKNANLASPSGVVPNGAGSSVQRGKKPARGFEPVDYTSDLVDWDGKMHQPPVGDDWDSRQPYNRESHERHALIKAWREQNAADTEENNRVIVNTASPNFQTGEGLTGGDANVLSPIEKMDHETRISNDAFTQARRHQNAAEAMKDYEAKMAAKPKTVPSGIEGMTREEKRALRRALLDEERTRVIPPNPHAPAVNIYLRPAEFKDMGQVMKIYNDYVSKTTFVLHLDPVDELYWRSRLQEAEDEKNPFLVAIHMGEKSCRHQGDIIRKKQENVVGFAVAANFGSKDTLYHSTVELELMVHDKFYRQGIGRTLLDRILAALSPDHNLLECAPFLPHNDISHWIRGGSRQAKAIMVNILYSDGEEDIVTWRKQWLAKYEFQHVGTLPHVAFKKGKLLNSCQLVLTTSVRL